MVTLWLNDNDSHEAKEGFHSSQPKFGFRYDFLCGGDS